MWDPYAEFEQITLNNGLEVYALKWPNASWQRVGFVVRAGAAFDPMGFEGLSHFLEHMVSVNGDMTPNEMHKFFGDAGGEVNFGTTGDFDTHYHFKVPSEEEWLPQALEIFGSMLVNATIKNGLEKERGAITSEFALKFPSPYFFDLAMKPKQMLFPGYWMGRLQTAIGRQEVIQTIQLPDLQAHYDALYHPANIKVVGVGERSVRELAEILCEGPFGIDKPAKRPSLQTAAIQPKPLSEKYQRVSISEIVSAKVDSGRYRSESALPCVSNRAMPSILDNMLGEKLFEQLRAQRGWAYDVDVDLRDYRTCTGLTISSSGIPFDVLEEVDMVVQKCIDSLSESEASFEETKRHGVANERLREFSSLGVLGRMASSLSKEEPVLSQEKWIDTIAEASFDEMRNLLSFLSDEYRFRTIYTK
ncbi:MAG TPA: insulinase family protein [Candidatus Paceibacterota bacterium]|nr:insulinase family protein [Candidatus Paceibacterota bacterium]